MQMRDRRKYVFAMLLYLLCIIGQVSAQTVPQLAKEALAATVLLELVANDGTPLGSASGFFVKPDTVVTNYHVIIGAAHGTVKQIGKHRKYKVEGVIATDKENNLALLKVAGYGIKPLPLSADSETIELGDKVYIAGHPEALEGTFSKGFIRSLTPENKKFLIKAHITPGSTGGAVLNASGEVLGVSFPVTPGSSSGGAVLNASGEVLGTDGLQQDTLHIEHLAFVTPSNALKALLAQNNRVKPLFRLKNAISVDTYYHRGYANYQQGAYEHAIADWTRIIQLDPENVFVAHNLRGIAKEKLGQHFAAIADYNTAIKLHPDVYVDAHNNRGRVKVILGDYAAAIRDFDTIIQLNRGKPPRVYTNRGIAKAALGKHVAAITDYDTVIKLHPKFTDALVNRGIAKAALGEHVAAIADYDTVIRLNPDDAKTYTHRGIAKAVLGEHVAAIADYNTAIKLSPNSADALVNRGIAKAALGQYADAISDYDTALRLKPNNAKAYYHHAKAYYHRGVVKLIFGYTTDGQHDLRIAIEYADQAGDVYLTDAIEQALTELK